MVDTMNFGQALAELKAGQRISRAGWNGKGMHLELQVPDEHSKMTLPYIYLVTPNVRPPRGTHGQTDVLDRVPWLASQTDILAEDWTVIAPEFRDGVPTSGLRGKAGSVTFPERG